MPLRWMTPGGFVVVAIGCAPAPTSVSPASTRPAPVSTPAADVEPQASAPTPGATPATAVATAASACETVHGDFAWTPLRSPSRPRHLVSPPRAKWEGIRAVKMVRDAIARSCPDLEGPPAEYLDPSTWDEDPGHSYGVTRSKAGGLLEFDLSEGNGVHGNHNLGLTRYDLRRCDTESASVDYYDQNLTGALSAAETSTLPVGERLDASDPQHAYAALLLSAGDECSLELPPDGVLDGWPPVPGAPTFELAALPFVEQPELKGRPRRQVRVRKASTPGDGDWTDVLVEAPLGPHRLHRVGAVDIYGADLPGRNAGFALAVHDRRANRHRWVALTRGCISGTVIHWLADGDDLVVGYAVSGHPIYAEEGRDGLFVLDLRHGRAHRLLLEGSPLVWEPKPGEELDVLDPPPELIGRMRKDRRTLRTRCGNEVPLADIRAAIDAT